MSIKYSFNAQLFSASARATWGSTGSNGLTTGAAPGGLTLIANVMDVEIPLEDTELDVSIRGGLGTKMTAQGLRDVSIDIPMIYDTSDAGFIALQGAYLGRYTLPLAVLDGPATTGSEGVWADFTVTKMKKGEKLDDVQRVTFTIKPGYSAVPVQFVKCS